MVQGFKDFMLRGNIIELAVAVVIGTAFATLVGAFTASLITPVLASVGGGGEVAGLSFLLRAGNEATRVDVGATISAIIQFLLSALVVYVVFVLPMNALAERRTRGQLPAEEGPEPTVELLTEIRDLLRAQQEP